MAVPVKIFNASSQTITVMVNQGQQFTVLGTGAAQDWAPQTQAYGTGPSYSMGAPAPNVIGNSGRNILECFVVGCSVGGPVALELPRDYPVGSVQIFIFFATVQRATWVVLTDGRICAQQMTSLIEGEAPPE